MRFTAAPVDDSGNRLAPEVELGTTEIPLLLPRQVATAALDRVTSAREFQGPAGSSQRWRVRVELDPFDAVPGEIYETEDPKRLP